MADFPCVNFRRSTGQILWAFVDCGAQSEIVLTTGGVDDDLLAGLQLSAEILEQRFQNSRPNVTVFFMPNRLA